MMEPDSYAQDNLPFSSPAMGAFRVALPVVFLLFAVCLTGAAFPLRTLSQEQIVVSRIVFGTEVLSTLAALFCTWIWLVLLTTSRSPASGCLRPMRSRKFLFGLLGAS